MRGRKQLLSLLKRWDRREEPIPSADLIAALDGLPIGYADLADVIGFDDACYRRTIIHTRPHYQVLVLCWRSGQRSPIHNHRGSSCVVRVVQGCATETRFDPTPSGRLAPTGSHEHREGETTACCGEEIHQMGNFEAPGRDLVTLHIYSAPPLAWRFFAVGETTLADHDRLIRKPARTVRIDLADLAPARPMGRKVKGGSHCPA
jgi:cysteine dioxygenase